MSWELFELSHHPVGKIGLMDVEVHCMDNCNVSVAFMKVLVVGAESDISVQSLVKFAVKFEEATIMPMGLFVELSIRDQLKLKSPQDGPASLMSVDNQT